MVQNIHTNVIKKKRIVYHLVCELEQCEVRNFAKFEKDRSCEWWDGRGDLATLYAHMTYMYISNSR